MKKKKLRTLLCVFAALAALTAAASMAAGGAGSQSDPLVTLSYLTDTFTDQIMDKVDKLLAERNARLTAELGGQSALPGQAPDAASAGYAAVTLSAGQSLYGEAGCEVMLRSGSAVCASTAAAALVDSTGGGTLGPGGSLQQNHLYLMPEGRTISSAGGAVLLVRGAYLVG